MARARWPWSMFFFFFSDLLCFKVCDCSEVRYPSLIKLKIKAQTQNLTLIFANETNGGVLLKAYANAFYIVMSCTHVNY